MFDLCTSMFLRDRSTQAEYFDEPGLPPAERAAALRELDRINRVFQFSHPFVSQIPRWLGRERCRRLEILDIGAGSGLLGERLAGWARRRGWDWQFTNLDTQPLPSASSGAQPAKFVTGSALELPFADNSFDLVIASQMTHHLSDAEVVQHWREALRVTRDGVFICDLHRNATFYGLLWLAMNLMGCPRKLREDGLLSVKRGFLCPEWKALAAHAKLPAPRIWVYFGTRIILQSRKAVP